MSIESEQTLDLSADALVKTNSPGAYAYRSFGVGFRWTGAQAAAASTTGVHAAVTDNGSSQTIVTGITNPPCARNITATAGGTSGDVKAIQVIVYGTNLAGERISETLPAFTVNTTGTVTGSKAFLTVDRIVIPAHDGTGATTAIGFGSKLGLPVLMTYNSHLMTFLGTTKEGTAPTLASSTSAVESNTILLNSSLDGSAVRSHWLLPI